MLHRAERMVHMVPCARYESSHYSCACFLRPAPFQSEGDKAEVGQQQNLSQQLETIMFTLVEIRRPARQWHVFVLELLYICIL